MLNHSAEDETFAGVDFHIGGMGPAVAEPVGTDGETEAVVVIDGSRRLT